MSRGTMRMSRLSTSTRDLINLWPDDNAKKRRARSPPASYTLGRFAGA